MISDEVYEQATEEENYFVSMTDMMVGLVFIFIIMLMYFAMQFRDVTDQLTSTNRTRTQILRELQRSLQEKGVKVSIDTQTGVLHLPDSILFDKGKAELREDGAAAAGKLASALIEVLPCYTNSGARANCPDRNQHFLESLYIEGHTDIDPPRGVGCLQDNLALSACRSVNTFRALIAAQPALGSLCTLNEAKKCEKILSVSGYGAERLIEVVPGEEAQRHNRRIDLRLLMMTPDGGAAAQAIAKKVGE